MSETREAYNTATQLSEIDESHLVEALPQIRDAVIGKTIADIKKDDYSMNQILIIVFTDGSALSIEYDWLYEAKVVSVSGVGER